MAAFALLLLAALSLLAAGVPDPDSPCPQYFRYSGGGNKSSMAIISIPAKVNQLPLHLRVQLALQVALKTKYVGMMVLSENPTAVLGNLLTGKATQVNYTVRFPLPEPIPTLEKITLNNKTICTGIQPHINSIYGGVVTEILLEHTFPSQPIAKKKLGERDIPKYLPADDQDFKCGISRTLSSEGDEKVKQKEYWPWLAAIFLIDYRGVGFHCTGSLISRKHVITAAHCLRNQNNKSWNTSNFVVYLGLHNLSKYEDDFQEKKVTNILIHPEYDEKTHEADIAILVIEPSTFNEYISPVCLWDIGISLEPIIGHIATVVGWRPDNSQRIQLEPEVFHLPIVDQVECLRSNKEFLYVTSDRTICAGWRNGTGPCNGESGSGLLIQSYNRKSALAWHLRGLISLSLLDRNKVTCDLNQYIVFTDVARFNNWTIHIISNY